jgi:hypothetical protein
VANRKHPLLLSYFPQAFILVTLLSSAPAWAAGGPPMYTDDPGTPGDGHWEINVAALSGHNAQATIYQLPLVDANYGVGDRLQLKFEMPWLYQTEANNTSRSGLGDGLVGVKWRFYDAGKNAWQISTYPQVEFGFPLSNSAHNGLISSGTSYLLPIEIVHGFEGVDVNFELGRWFRPAQQVDSWIAGCALTHQVKQGFELIAELHDESAMHQPQDELILNFGTRWDFSKQYTLLLSAGRDLHNTLGATNTSLTYLGVQIRY